MNDPAWTLGPWQAGAFRTTVYDADGTEIAECIGEPPYDEATSAANARLIAAAPELYDALANLVFQVREANLDYNWPKGIATAVAILARARGEPI